MTVLSTTLFRRPGWGSWLALLLALTLTGICAVAWAQNEYIVARLLSEGVIEESATRTLPSTVRYIALRAGIAGLVVAALLALWGVCGIPPWAPVQVCIAYLKRALRPRLSPLWSLAGSTYLALRRGLALLVRPLQLGFFTLARASSWALRYGWLALSAVFRYARLAASTLAGVLALGVVAAARPFWLGVSIIAQAIGAGLRYAWRGLSTIFSYLRIGGSAVAQAGDLGLRYARRGIVNIAGQWWLAVSTAGRLLGLGVGAVTRPLWRGISGIAQANTTGLRYGWRGVSTVFRYLRVGVSAVAQALSFALHYMRVAIGTTAAHLWLAASTAGRLLLLGVHAVTRSLWLGVSGVVSAIGAGLRCGWRGIATIAGQMWLAASRVARLLGLGVGAVMRPLWLVVSGIAQANTAGLRYEWRGVSAVFRYLRVGVSAVAQALSFALHYMRVAIGATAAYLGLAAPPAGRLLELGASGVAGAIGAGLRYAWLGISTIFTYLRAGVSTVAQAGGLALRCAWSAISTIAGQMWLAVSTAGRLLGLGVVAVMRPLWLVVSAIARAIGTGLRNTWLGISTIYGYLGGGVARFLGIVAPGTYRSARLLGLGGYTVIRPFWGGASIIAQAVGRGLGYVWLGICGILRYLWLGVSTATLALAWACGYLWRVMLVILQTLGASPMFVARTVGTAGGVVPDIGRMVLWLTIKRKEVHAMSDFNLTRERLLALVVTMLVIFVSGSIAVRVLWPAPPEPTVEVVHWANGHLMRDGLLPDMAAQFNKASHKTQSGTRIMVKVHDVPSELQAEYLVPRVNTGRGPDLNELSEGYVAPGYSDPTIVTPSDAHWMVTVNHEVGRAVVDLSAAQSIVRPVVGIVTYEEMARCLGWPQKELGYADIIALRNDPQGWGKYPCSRTEWGQRPLLAFTDPTTSSTGRSLLLGLYSIAGGTPPEHLTLEDVKDPEVVNYVKQFQGLIDHYLIGTTVLNTKIYQGPRYGHFFIMPEDNLIHLYEGTERAFINGVKVQPQPISQRMVMIYPKEGSMPRNNCACIVQADWVSEEQVEAGQKWIEFIREDEQQRAFMAAGFRPGTDIPLNDRASKISEKFGLDPTKPTVWLKPSLIDPSVAAAIDESWEEVKRPGIVTFVVDTSGSMMGTKIQQAKDGLVRALDAMAQNNQVGLLTFANTVNTTIPVGPLTKNRFAIAGAVREMRAGGETALYDAIKQGVAMTEAAESEVDAIRAVVVLTDGRANQGQTRLDNLIQMMSRNETTIRQFDGFSGSQAVDNRGGRIAREEITGTGLAIETRHPIQVFFIGIGEDADLEVGRMLAEATGAEFQGATEKDLANVLAEFSKYF